VSKAKTPSGVDMGIVDIPCTELHNDPANVRKHGEQNLAAIKASLARFGQQKPIVVNQDGVVIAGNGTLMAARALGWQTIKAVRTNLAGSEATAFAIADNRTAELAEWDDAALQQQLAAIAIDDEELLAATGFDEKELAKLAAANAPEVTEDDVPEPPADPITQPGDLWLMGKHRLLCGDSTKAEDVERLMDGSEADALVTDPPYGIGIASNPVRQKHAKSDWDAKPVQPRIFVESVAQSIVWGGNYFDLPPCKGFFVWDKKQPEDFTLAMCEMAWTNIDTPAKMFRLSVTSYEKQHPTQKPIELIAWCLSYTTGKVLDPFLGSGTTLIAAEQLGRICYGMEISPAYCDVIVKRWETLTGQTATREEV
jgi:ParB-like chromosome segregation protein Spo0J